MSTVNTHKFIPRTGCSAPKHTFHGTILWLQTSKGRPVLTWMLVNNVEVFKTALRNTGWKGGRA